MIYMAPKSWKNQREKDCHIAFYGVFVCVYLFLISRKRGNCDALQLEGRPTSRQSSWAVLAKFVLCLRTNCSPSFRSKF